MRSTDVCHPNDLRAPAPRAFPARSRRFRGGESPRSLGLRVALPGTWTFHDVPGRFGGSNQHHVVSCSTASRPGDTSVGVFFPRWRCDRASDTPVATLRFILRLARFRGRCIFTVRSLALFGSGVDTYGSENATDRRDHRGRRPVKSDASWWSGMSSVDKDPS